LLERLVLAEQALATAAAAVEALRVVAQLGPHATAALRVGDMRLSVEGRSSF